MRAPYRAIPRISPEPLQFSLNVSERRAWRILADYAEPFGTLLHELVSIKKDKEDGGFDVILLSEDLSRALSFLHDFGLKSLIEQFEGSQSIPGRRALGCLKEIEDRLHRSSLSYTLDEHLNILIPQLTELERLVSQAELETDSPLFPSPAA